MGVNRDIEQTLEVGYQALPGASAVRGARRVERHPLDDGLPRLPRFEDIVGPFLALERKMHVPAQRRDFGNVAQEFLVSKGLIEPAGKAPELP